MRLIDLQKSKLPKSTTKVTSNRQTDFFLPQIQTQSQNILGNIYLNSNITFSAECLLTQYHAQWLFYSIRVRLVGGLPVGWGFFIQLQLLHLYILMMTKCNVVVTYFICVKYVFYLIQWLQARVNYLGDYIETE